MVSVQEKEDFLKRLIMHMETQKQFSEALKEIYEILLRDTNEGKLYKYRSFDESGYALENLRNGTMHCSKPCAFNDPFEFKLGVSFKTLLAALFMEEYKALESILELLREVICGNMQMDECNGNEQRVIRKVLDSQDIIKFFANDLRMVTSEDELTNTLVKNISLIVKLMQIVFSDEMFSYEMKSTAHELMRLVENNPSEVMRLLVDDNAEISDFARLYGINDDVDEIELCRVLAIKLMPGAANQIDTALEKFADLERGLNDAMNNSFLVGCLCTSFKNHLMWSHYADSHRGFCIEYDYSEAGGQELSGMLLPVVYSAERRLVPWKMQIDNNSQMSGVQVLLGMMTKDSAWSYENEWRVLSNVRESPDIKMPRVSCIYLGVSISDEHRAEVLKIAEELHIPVKQMVLDRVKYALRTKDVSC